jgi:lactate racemase
MRMNIPFVNKKLIVDIPASNLLFDISPKDFPAEGDPDMVIQQAMNQPIGAPTLEHLVQPGMQVIIISDDNTRATPTNQIIPILLDRLNLAGIADRDIRIIIASGTHRAMTEDELEEKYGSVVLSRVQILPHRYKDRMELVACGSTVSGTPILANRHVIEADFRIAVGSIVPHHPAGWSGGAKAVLPGIGGEETVAKMHLYGSRYPALGRIDSAMRREMEDFASRINLNYILNVVLNRDGHLVGAFAGHFIHAHRRGVEQSREVYGVPIPKLADLVISSTTPVDFDFFQGDKGITSAELATKPGGEIACVTGCLEGISPAHPELADYVGKMSTADIWKMLETQPVQDPLTAAEAIVINDIQSKMQITLVTDGLSPDLCRSMHMRHVSPEGLAEYIQVKLQQQPALKIGIMRNSAELLPFLEDSSADAGQ